VALAAVDLCQSSCPARRLYSVLAGAGGSIAAAAAALTFCICCHLGIVGAAGQGQVLITAAVWLQPQSSKLARCYNSITDVTAYRTSARPLPAGTLLAIAPQVTLCCCCTASRAQLAQISQPLETLTQMISLGCAS
jgi:hypothetical protein